MKAKVETLRAGSFEVELTSENQALDALLLLNKSFASSQHYVMSDHDYCPQVFELRKAVAARMQLPGPEFLKLVSGGQAIDDKDVLRPNGAQLQVLRDAVHKSRSLGWTSKLSFAILQSPSWQLQCLRCLTPP